MEQQESRTQTLVDGVGKPFIQAEELTERIATMIDGCAADYAIGFAAVFGASNRLSRNTRLACVESVAAVAGRHSGDRCGR